MTREQLEQSIQTQLPTNGVGLIAAVNTRQVATDIADYIDDEMNSKVPVGMSRFSDYAVFNNQNGDYLFYMYPAEVNPARAGLMTSADKQYLNSLSSTIIPGINEHINGILSTVTNLQNTKQNKLTVNNPIYLTNDILSLRDSSGNSINSIISTTSEWVNAQNKTLASVELLKQMLYSKSEVNSILDAYYNKSEIDSTLSNYYTKAETSILLNDYYTKSYVDNNYYNKNQTNTLLNNFYSKDYIDDLVVNYYNKLDVDNMFRTQVIKNIVLTPTAASFNNWNNTQLFNIPGATDTLAGLLTAEGYRKLVASYVKPDEGIPSTDLTESIQESLDKADTAVQPTGDYPELIAGMAKNLVELKQIENDKVYREVANGEDVLDSNADVLRIEGQSTKWNQLLATNSLGSADNWEFRTQYTSFTPINNNEGVVKRMFLNGICAIRSHSKELDTSHMYYLSATVKRISENNTPIYLGLLSTSYAAGQRPSVNSDSTDWITLDLLSSPILVADSFGLRIGVTGSPEGAEYRIKNVCLIDVTEIYGIGNEPTTTEEFITDMTNKLGRNLLEITNVQYDDIIMSTNLTGIKTVGFNLLNPETGITKGLMTTEGYQITGPYSAISINGNTITPDGNGKFNIDEPGDIIVTGYTNRTCIHLVKDGSKDGQYEEYKESTLNIPINQLTGKLSAESESVVIFPNGMNSIGDVKDELYISGGKLYAIKRVRSRYLGELNFVYIDGVDNPYFRFTIIDIQKLPQNRANYLCENYLSVNPMTITEIGNNTQDMIITKRIVTGGTNTMYIRNTAYTDGDIFKESVQNVKIIYVLDKPETYEIDNIDLPLSIPVYNFGTEEQLLIEPSTAASILMEYSLDGRQALRRDYITKTSMDNFLTQLGTAMNGTWTSTWNESNQAYDFTFTPNTNTSNTTNIDNETSI